MNTEKEKIQKKNYNGEENSEEVTDVHSTFWTTGLKVKLFLEIICSLVVICFILIMIKNMRKKDSWENTAGMEGLEGREVETMETESMEEKEKSLKEDAQQLTLKSDDKNIGFIKNNIAESSNWVDDCSCSEKVRSEISFYFDSGKQDKVNQYLKKSPANSLNKNFIFYGEPGTGKSYCALQIAKGISSSYIVIPGGTLQKIYVGSGASQWKKIIDNAKRNAKNAKNPVVVIVEEIDSLARKKDEPPLWGDETLVNSFLESIDSIRKSKLKIVIIGTTNVIDYMESAATRIGRFNKLYFEYPNREDLSNILKGVRREVENNYNVKILDTDENSGNAHLENGTPSDNKKFIFIYNSYWSCLKEKILAKPVTLENEYPIIFPQVSSCVERVIRETINSAEVPTLGKELGYKTGEYILELGGKKLPSSSNTPHKIFPLKRKSLAKLNSLINDQIWPSSDGQGTSLYAEISKLQRKINNEEKGSITNEDQEGQWNEPQQNQSCTTLVESGNSGTESVMVAGVLWKAGNEKLEKNEEARGTAKDSAEK